MPKVLFENRTVSLAGQERPVPGPDEALIRVLTAGICNTDIELLKGYMNFSGTPGHEFVGVVEEAASASHLVGRRVVADINIGPGPGDHRHTEGRRVLGILDCPGAFATWLVLPVRNLILVPEGLPDEAAVFAEPLAAGLEVAQQVHIKATDRVLVLGDGKLGVLTALGLRHYCPRLVLAGRHPDKLAIAQAQGVRTSLSQHLFGAFDIVVEATGNPEGLGQALKLVRPEGTIVPKSTTEADSSINLAQIVVREITLVGSRCGDLRLALDHLSSGLVDPSGLIQSVHPLDDFARAFAEASRPGARKVLLRIGQ